MFKMVNLSISDPDFCPGNCGPYTFDPIQNTDLELPSEEFVIVKANEADFQIVYNIERIPAEDEIYEIPTGKHYIRVSGWDTRQSNIARTEAELNVCECDSDEVSQPVCPDALPITLNKGGVPWR